MRKIYRLSDNKDFVVVYKKGKSTANRFFVLYVYKRMDSGPFRLGVSISKKIGNAVTRNRIKRLVKAVFLDFECDLPVGYDLVVISRTGARHINFYQAKDALSQLFKRSRII